MIGFLHQLAARSLGRVPEVRPRAALPYAAPTMDALNAEASALQPAPAGLTPEAQRPGSIAAETTDDNFRPNNVLPTPLLAASSLKNPPADRPANTGSSATAAADGQLGVLAACGPHATRVQTDIEAGHRDDKTNPLSPPEEPIYLHAEPAPAHTNQAGQSSEPSRIADLENLVSRLIGQGTNPTATQPDTRPSTSCGTAQATTQRSTPVNTIRPLASREPPAITAAESIPEVHITIGRLEVSPPSRPAPTPPPRPRGPAPLSLSDYLDRRNGGRS
jgi:hypothetical protein